MRALVFVKDVPSGSGLAPYRTDLRLDRANADGAMSGVDLFAVAEAVRLGARVTVATMGPDAARATLRDALAVGADAAVHVSDDALAGADAQTTAEVLAAVVRRIRPDMVLLGRESSDARMGVMSGMLAAHLGWPALSAVDLLRIDRGTVRARRRSADTVDDLQTTLPVVVSAAEYAADPRPIDAPALRRAYLAPVTTWSAADLGVAPHRYPDTPLVLDVMETPARRAGRVVPAATAADLGAVLAEFGHPLPAEATA